jgi:hypothetical protein
MSESPEEFTREEQAFRASFAETEEFEPLDPAQFVRPARRRVHWERVLGVAAAIVVVAGAGIGLSQLGGRGMAATVAEAQPSAASVTAQDKGEAAGGGVGQPAPPRPQATNDFGSSAASWTVTSKAPLTRVSPATGWLDGRFYLIGGAGACGPTADCKAYRDGAAYNPSTNSWTPVAAAPVALEEQAGVAFQGKLYFTWSDDPKTSMLVAYDPQSNSWNTIAAPGRRAGGLVVAGDQLISVGLGTRLAGDATDRIYDPASNTWTVLPTDPFSPDQARSVVVVGDRLVLWALTLSGEKWATFDLATQTWTPIENLSARGGMTAVGDWLAFQRDGSAMLDTYRPADGASSGIAMDFGKEAIDQFTATGMLQLNGTVVGNRIVHYGELIDPSTNAMSLLPELPKATLTGQVAIGSPNGLLVYRVTGENDKAKATAYYLPVSP